MRRFKVLFTLGYIALIFFSAIYIPPMEKPDEPVHFLKALTMAETLQFFCPNSGDNIPLSKEMVSLAIKPQKEIGGVYPNTCSLPFIYYLPSMAAIIILRRLGVNSSFYIYAGRLINGLLFLGVSLWAIKISAKEYRKVIILFMFLPIVWMQTTSLNKDWATFTFSILLFSFYTKLIDKAKLNLKFMAAIFLTFLGLVLTRISYLPLVIPLAAGIYYDTTDKRLKSKAMFLFIFVLTFGLLIYGLWFLPKINHLLIQLPDKNNIYPSYQIISLISRPLRFWKYLHRTIVNQLIQMLKSSIGTIGWDKTPIPDYVYLLFVILWAKVIFILNQEMKNGKTLGLMAGVVLSMFLILTSSYFFNTSIYAPMIQGLQGRYFTPLIPFVALGIAKQTYDSQRVIILIWVILSIFSVMSTIIQAF